MKRIESKEGLKELLKRYKKAGVKDSKNGDEWIKTIKVCIKDNLAMDELDYANTPENLKKLWIGLK